MEHLFFICHDKISLIGLSVFQANTNNAETDAKTALLRVKGSPAFTDWTGANEWLTKYEAARIIEGE